MRPPPSSRTVDPRLAAAGGVLRDTVGGIHNLQRLLGSMKVGPKALARVVPDVHASCSPMAVAVTELVAALRERHPHLAGPSEVGQLVTGRLRELEKALSKARTGTMRATDRLRLEAAMSVIVRELDGSLELVELFVEASARGAVPVNVGDVIRESAVRPGQPQAREHRVTLTVGGPGRTAGVQVNPRLALRLFSLGLSIAAGDTGTVHAEVVVGESSCDIRVARGPGEGDRLIVAAPPLIGLSTQCAAEIADHCGSAVSVLSGDQGVLVAFPLALPE